MYPVLSHTWTKAFSLPLTPERAKVRLSPWVGGTRDLTPPTHGWQQERGEKGSHGLLLLIPPGMDMRMQGMDMGGGNFRYRMRHVSEGEGRMDR